MDESCILGCAVCAELREAALGIVGDDGIDALSLPRLAEQSGIDAGEVRRHYPTVSSCLYETYEEVARAVYEDFAEAFRAEPGWRRGLALASRTLLARMADRPAEARLCFVEVLRGDHELQRQRVAAHRRLLQLFVRELRRRTDGEDVLSELQLELMIGAGFQMISAAVAAGRTDELRAFEEELISRGQVFEPAAV